MERKASTRVRHSSEADVLQERENFLSKPPNDEPLPLNRSISRASFRATFKASKSKLDEFFKNPLDFGSKRSKRNRCDDDSLSLCSVDVTAEEPKKKRRSSLAKVSSLAGFLSPVPPVKKVGSSLQKSISVWALKSQKSGTLYRDPSSYATPPRRRLSVYWYETVGADKVVSLDKTQLDRQEAIFELFRSEEELIEDLNMVKTTYHDSLKKLHLMTDAELSVIFGHIDTLLPLHQELVDKMKLQRQPSGSTECIGPVLIEWIPKLEEVYASYCANQVFAKSVLDLKKQDAHIEDFLERCLESPFSRHLDLWNFLDVPRSRLVKYPLLLKTIQKHTPAGNPDRKLIDEALLMLDSIIKHVDVRTGEAKCAFVKHKLRYAHDDQKCCAIEESNAILCDGQLRNNRGTKLYVCLFEKALVLTRPMARDGTVLYQVYSDPVLLYDLVVEDLRDGCMQSGSFKRVFTPNQSAYSSFRVCSASDSVRSHTLHANDELDKRHWLQCIDEALVREGLPVASASDTKSRLSAEVSSADTATADFHSPAATNSADACVTSLEAELEENAESVADDTVETSSSTMTPHSTC